MISIGVQYGGPEQKNTRVRVMLVQATSAAMRARDNDYDNGAGGWINPIFIVPGSMHKPDFQGCKLGHFSSKRKGLVVMIAVPEAVARGDGLKEFISSSLRAAVNLASERFASNRIPFSTLKAEKIIRAIEAAL